MPKGAGVAEAGHEMTSMLGRGVDTPCVVSVQRTAEHLQPDGGDGTMTYAEMLRDPRWQKRRLEVLNAAGWMCSSCFDETTELHVHHVRYKWNRKPWEYPDEELSCLCKKCHSEETAAWSMLRDELMLIGVSARMFVPLVVGHLSGHGFLGPRDELIGRAQQIDCDLVLSGEIAARIEHLPEDLARDVHGAIDAATAEMNRRIAVFVKSQQQAPKNA